jgi:hypothetical protein
MKVSPYIFREYDIRGKVGVDFTEEVVRELTDAGITVNVYTVNTPEEKEAIRLHRESFKKYGLLGAFPVIRVQEDLQISHDCC